MTQNEKVRPLSGIKIVEVGVWHAGPGASATLSDLGAEVIKVESLDGDQARLTGKSGPLRTARLDRDEWTVLYDLSNRGKRSVSIDLRKPEGQEILNRLVAKADIFITNLRKSTKSKMGIDYLTLSKVNPSLIHLNVSGFGPKGAMADSGAFDTLGQAMSGMMYTYGDTEPAPLQLFLLDQFASVAASHAALTALVARNLRGIGQEVHVSLLGSAIWLMQTNIVSASVMGEITTTKWDRSKNSPLRNTVRVADGWIVGTNHPETKKFPVLCQALGRPDLIDDARFATAADREANLAEMNTILEPIFLEKTREEWLAIFDDADLFYAPVLDYREVMSHPQVVENGYMTTIDHPVLGPITVPAHPVHFSESAPPEVHPAPVEVGQDTTSVLAEYGYSAAEIDQMRQANLIRTTGGES